MHRLDTKSIRQCQITCWCAMDQRRISSFALRSRCIFMSCIMIAFWSGKTKPKLNLTRSSRLKMTTYRNSSVYSSCESMNDLKHTNQSLCKRLFSDRQLLINFVLKTIKITQMRLKSRCVPGTLWYWSTLIPSGVFQQISWQLATLLRFSSSKTRHIWQARPSSFSFS